MQKRLEERVNTYGSYLKKRYGKRIFRLGLSINRDCPHRKENGGCIFCSPESFTDRRLAGHLEVKQQIETLLPEIRRGCGPVGLLAYFHHETSTASDLDYLKHIFSETLKHNEIKGLIISTRPDYLNEKIMSMLKELKGEVFLEIGLQSIREESLDFLKRGHTAEDFTAAAELCSRYGIEAGVHLILGIPGETREDMLRTVEYLNGLEMIKQIKFHNLVVYKGTELARYPREILDSIPDLEEYIALLAIVLQHTRGDRVISRLFTSNVNRDGRALNSFPGLKRSWLNRLSTYLDKNDIVQGSATGNPYNPGN